MHAFFNIQPLMSGVLHKRTYLRSYKYAPAYLRLAVCAAGANVPFNSALSEKDSLWYIRQVIPMLAVAVRQPRLECVQALVILSLTASYVGEESAALAHAEGAARMALTLGLNIDPDDSGSLFHLSWLEKESRRRCFWYSFIGDQVRQAVTSCESILSMSTSSVKPVGPESVWTSLGLPESLKEEFESRRSVEDNPIHWMVQLLEILHRVQMISRSVEHDDIEDDSSLRLTEEMLEADLSRWCNTIPTSFWHKSEELLSGKTEEEGFSSQTPPAVSFVFHGCMCLLMRRRSMRCIRSLCSGIPAAASIPEEDLLAFKKGLDAAKAMARIILLFDCNSTHIGLLPQISMFLCLHGAMLLIVVEWLKSPKSPVGLAGQFVQTDLLSPGIDGDNAAEENEKFTNPKIMIDCFISVGTKVDRMQTTSNYLLSIASKFRAGDWEFLDELDQDSGSPAAVLTEAKEQGPSSSVLANTRALGDSHSFLEPATDFSSLSTKNSTSSFRTSSSFLSGGVHSPQMSVAGMFRTQMREFIKPLLEVRSSLGQQALLGSNPTTAVVDLSSTLRRRMQMPSGAASWPPRSALAAVHRYRTTRPPPDLFGLQGSSAFTFSGADGQENDQHQAGWVGDGGEGVVDGGLLAAASDSMLFGKDGSSGDPRFLFKSERCYEEGDADILLDWLSSSRSTVR
ncbi:hypothetical protein DFJ73DRAFT_241472 [Zopfochytrium polystomum]|nr:hypothetical protein DFJ73DRAFT_241472 [Zopfochytrium polystomum]